MRYFFRNPLSTAGLTIFLLIASLAICAPILPLPHPNASDLQARLLPMFSPGHPLGTDLLGRDILSRLIWGTRVSILVALAATLIAAVCGSTIGIVAGYFGKWADSILMRGIDMLMAFPYLILALAIVAVLGPGLFNALLAIAVVNIPFFARTTRGVTLGIAKRPFIDAARVGGQNNRSILLREVLPNVLPTIVITLSTTLGWMILETAGLSFLGLGARPPNADLGSMLADGRTLMLIAPHVALLPGVVILLLVVALNLVGDGLRDALDPRMKSACPVQPGAATATRLGPPPPSSGQHIDKDPLLTVENLCVSFSRADGSRIRAVKGVSFNIQQGECVGIVGESGSGKSVTALALTRLLPSPPAMLESGEIRFQSKDLGRMPANALRHVRGCGIGYIFQDPLGSLNPMLKVGTQIAEALSAHKKIHRRQAWQDAVALLASVSLNDPAATAHAFPHQLSGGQRQRVGIAMAIANTPPLIIADEPTTALDVTVQRDILQLLGALRRSHNMAMLFISHDLGVVNAVCDRVLVMYQGQIVESGNTRAVLQSPKHDYTRRLLQALPKLGNHTRKLPDR